MYLCGVCDKKEPLLLLQRFFFVVVVFFVMLLQRVWVFGNGRAFWMQMTYRVVLRMGFFYGLLWRVGGRYFLL